MCYTVYNGISEHAELRDIDATFGWFILEGDGDIRPAKWIGTTSRSGLTGYIKGIEPGAIQGFRADQIPAPEKVTGDFVVFPVGRTGFDSYNLNLISKDEWSKAVRHWRIWRQKGLGVVPSSEEGVWRLARNHTRHGGTINYPVVWRRQELLDRINYGGRLVFLVPKDTEDYHIVVDLDHNQLLVSATELYAHEECNLWVHTMYKSDIYVPLANLSNETTTMDDSITISFAFEDGKVMIRSSDGAGGWIDHNVTDTMIKTGKPFNDEFTFIADAKRQHKEKNARIAAERAAKQAKEESEE